MSNSNILVSVIAPAYNVDRFLAGAIESIQAQTHSNFELIIVIDGSPDNSAQIAKDYAKKDERIVVLEKDNGGVSSARNMGIDHAKGDYICFIDTDDYVERDYISHMLNLAVNYEADIALTTEMFWSFRKNNQTKNDQVKVFSGEDATAEILYYRVPIGCVCKLFKLSLLKNHRIRFLDEYRVGEGFNFNTTAFQYANKVISSQRKTYFYFRENEGSAMTVFSPSKCENGIRAIESIRNNLVIKSRKLSTAVDFADYHTRVDFFLWMIKSRSNILYPNLRKQLLSGIRRKALRAVFSEADRHEKLRAALMLLSPNLRAKIWIGRKRLRVNENE